jgi:hypothetical protein
MPRKPPGRPTDTNTTIHHPGAYQAALQRVCHHETSDPVGFLDASDDPVSLAAHEGNEAAKLFACIRRYNGEPLTVQYWALPDGLLKPFENSLRGGHRTFVVTPDDVITLQPST